MSVNDLHDTFVYHLEMLYYVENELVEVLDRLSAEAANDDLREALEKHRGQTETHVSRLEAVFDEIGEPVQERRSPTFDALLEEREDFLDVGAGDDDLRDVHDLGAAVKAEHLEIAGYETLLVLARKLDLSSDVRSHLEDNLDEEKQTKKQLKALATDSTVRKIFTRLAG